MIKALPSRSGGFCTLTSWTHRQSEGGLACRTGVLLSHAESECYEAFITTDTNLKYQQNLSKRKIRIIVLTSTSWPRIRKKTDMVRAALETLGEGGYAEVEI